MVKKILTLLVLKLLDHEIKRSVRLIYKQIFKKTLKQLIALVLFKILLASLSVFKFLNFIHFFIYNNLNKF
jgi:hypothetical protein